VNELSDGLIAGGAYRADDMRVLTAWKSMSGSGRRLCKIERTQLETVPATK
jgi:hypothetical protein